uniref:Uncharacterized protein n=1 Tax=Engystomops pustulosus TaxID=76066 RepID=A0AAV6YXZ9_ENGPU|nr:hypothetical protein GDO81_020023 [Engystomops pustulosus]
MICHGEYLSISDCGPCTHLGPPLVLPLYLYKRCHIGASLRPPESFGILYLFFMCLINLIPGDHEEGIHKCYHRTLTFPASRPNLTLLSPQILSTSDTAIQGYLCCQCY